MPTGLIDNSSVLGSLSYKQEFTYTNETGGFNDTTGRWEPNTSAPVAAFGSIQPLLREDYREVISWDLGGARILSAILIFTQTDLIAAENGNPTSSTGSTVQYNGLDWKVIEVQDFLAHGHKEVTAVRIDGQDD